MGTGLLQVGKDVNRSFTAEKNHFTVYIRAGWTPKHASFIYIDCLTQCSHSVPTWRKKVLSLSFSPFARLVSFYSAMPISITKIHSFCKIPPRIYRPT